LTTTIDNRWGPDFEGSRRRVREEEQDDHPPVFSRQLSVRAGPAPGSLESYGPRTRALIERQLRLERLPYHDIIGPLLAE
jgi:hypothetical protein